MSDGVTIVGELDALVGRLDEAGRELYRLHCEFDEVSEKYDDTFNDLLFTLISAYEDGEKKGRLPGKDAREAIVIKQMREQDPVMFGQYRRLRKELDRKHELARSIEREISAKQSNLSYLKTEAMAIR